MQQFSVGVADGDSELIAFSRRAFLATAIASSVTIPAGAKAHVPVLWGNGANDDTDAFQSLVNGRDVIIPPNASYAFARLPNSSVTLVGGKFRVLRQNLRDKFLENHVMKLGEFEGAAI